MDYPRHISGGSTPLRRSTCYDLSGRRIWPTAMPLLVFLLDEISRIQQSSTSSISPPPLCTSTSTSGGGGHNHHTNDYNNKSRDSSKHRPITVLELGAGCGLVGMGLIKSGLVDDMIMTDRDVTWLKTSVKANIQHDLHHDLPYHYHHPTTTTTARSNSRKSRDGSGNEDHNGAFVWSSVDDGNGDRGVAMRSLTVTKLEWGMPSPTPPTRAIVGLAGELPFPPSPPTPHQGEQDVATTTGSTTTAICPLTSSTNLPTTTTTTTKTASTTTDTASIIAAATARAMCSHPTLDYIVGSDLLYDAFSYDDLLWTLNDLSTSGHTQIVLAYPERDGEVPVGTEANVGGDEKYRIHDHTNDHDSPADGTLSKTTTTTTTQRFSKKVLHGGIFRMVMVQDLLTTPGGDEGVFHGDITTTTNDDDEKKEKYSIIRLIKT